MAWACLTSSCLWAGTAASAELAPRSDLQRARREVQPPINVNCNEDFVVWITAWSEAKKAWCCAHEARGCMPGVQPYSALEVGAAMAEDAAAPHSRKGTSKPKDKTTTTRTSTVASTRTSTSTATTTTVTTTTETVTTTTNTCSSECTVDGSTTTCADAIRLSSLRDFLGDPSSCVLAQTLIAGQCDACRGCPADAVGCGVLEPPTTTLPPPSDHPCQEDCTVGDQTAACEARILWVSDNLFRDTADSCYEAHKLIVSQCPICERCPLSQTTCTRGAAPDYDCSGDLEAWRPEQRNFCCKSHHVGCIFLADAPNGFKQKFELAGVSAVASRLASGGRPAVCAALAGAAALVVGSFVVVARRSRGVEWSLSSRRSYLEVPFQVSATDSEA